MRLPTALLAATIAATAWSYEDVPAWASGTPENSDPAFLGAANVTVRRADTLVTVEPDGAFVTERRSVFEVLRNDAAKFATDTESYNAASDKVLAAQAWLVRGGKEVEYRAKHDWVDVSANADGAIIDETRRIFLSFEGKAVKGDVLVYLTRIRSREFLGDKIFDYTPGEYPRTGVTVEFNLPPGWEVSAHTFGPMPAPTHEHEAGVSHWRLPDTPYLAEESFAALAPSGLIVSLKSPGAILATFRDWREVGSYVNHLQQPQCDTSPEMRAKVQALTAGCADNFARIRALGHYVQDLRYVAINRNLAIGHGFRPRAASEVCHVGYGDCKDKANLLCALLREAGIKSYLVLAWIADGALIDETVPSPAWFNHAIVAIALPSVPDEWRGAVVEHDGQNYLIFDPTSPTTVMGDIVEAVQGTRAFLTQDDGGVMITLPARDGASGFALNREITVQLAANGAARCDGAIVANGQLAAYARAWLQTSGTDRELEKMVSLQLSEGFRQATIGNQKFQDDLATGSARIYFTCTLPVFGQPLPGGRAVVKFDLFSHRQTPAFPESERHKPIRLPPLVINDTVRLELAPGQAVVEVPKPADLQSPYGKYTLAIAREAAGLLVTRRYELFRKVIPAEDFPRLKQFLNSVAKADRSAALLATAAP